MEIILIEVRVFYLHLSDFIYVQFLISLDIDECRTNSHSCDVNAACTNIKGGHNCTCKAGFDGDGKNCTGN